MGMKVAGVGLCRSRGAAQEQRWYRQHPRAGRAGGKKEKGAGKKSEQPSQPGVEPRIF